MKSLFNINLLFGVTIGRYRLRPMDKILIGLLLSSGLFIFPELIQAQSSNLSALRGLGTKELEQVLGPPDERRVSGATKETWLYGSSVILIREGKVSSWSDAGNLNSRSNLAKLNKSSSSSGAARQSSWKNPWTPAARYSASQAIDEIIARSEKK